MAAFFHSVIILPEIPLQKYNSLSKNARHGDAVYATTAIGARDSLALHLFSIRTPAAVSAAQNKTPKTDDFTTL